MNIFNKIQTTRTETASRPASGLAWPILRKSIRQAYGKIRRFVLVHFRKKYVRQQAALRQGTCNQCGNCCEILFRCPFLVKTADGMTACSIYHSRPGQCAAFPVNNRCLAEVDFDCSYTFPAQAGLQIEPAPLPQQAD